MTQGVLQLLTLHIRYIYVTYTLHIRYTYLAIAIRVGIKHDARDLGGGEAQVAQGRLKLGGGERTARVLVKLLEEQFLRRYTLHIRYIYESEPLASLSNSLKSNSCGAPMLVSHPAVRAHSGFRV